MLVLTNHILLYIYLTVKIIICHLRILSKVFINASYPFVIVHYKCELYTRYGGAFMAKSKKIDKELGFRLKKARLDQKLTYDELSEKSGVSSRYIKEIENHGNVPSLEKLGQLIRALHISADPFFYPAVPSDNLDYQRLLVYLSECSADQITTILALVEAYLRTYKKLD